MPKMINGNLNLSGYEHKVTADGKLTIIEGLIVDEGGMQINVKVELGIKDYEDDISPVLPLDSVEPVTFVILPKNVQDELAAEADGKSTEVIDVMPDEMDDVHE